MPPFAQGNTPRFGMNISGIDGVFQDIGDFLQTNTAVILIGKIRVLFEKTLHFRL